MHETPITIATWAAATFGVEASLDRMARRVEEEALEMIEAMREGDAASISEEVADTYITMCHMCRIIDEDEIPFVFAVPKSDEAGVGRSLQETIDALVKYTHLELATLVNMRQIVIFLYEIMNIYGGTLEDAVTQKMIINRLRKWNIKGGVGQHVEESK